MGEGHHLDPVGQRGDVVDHPGSADGQDQRWWIVHEHRQRLDLDVVELALERAGPLS
jgi:hypothetical protein